MVTLSLREGTLTAVLRGDIDHHSASQMRTEIDRAVRGAAVRLLVLDFSQVTFMDSSGIGLVMGRYKLMSELGGEVAVADPPAYIARVMRLSGLDRLCRIVSIAQPIVQTEVIHNAEK
ncbi:stage II sporulation protein AA (anti-sigma F factor antagonist) [Ruminococcus sp. YE71]|uniref:STAS domain-containing protein n=1 Tax=unclassified Ruminococcus TaxID=2608920 RepID=UPI000881CCF4|nr:MULTISPECIES: anti-sigma factor antagonist [unclassified Ruminococcus]SDA14745.1 stage II sporulation protein AA (anti-sigma F factor antagonist) [Ruminococcus sp. YE78]SFW21418.1 stage II sporulation protein AA (anti-sigma F factor antagonist) [Ruminococcus sp. YE71]